MIAKEVYNFKGSLIAKKFVKRKCLPKKHVRGIQLLLANILTLRTSSF